MSDIIRFYPKKYVMSESLILFFKTVSSDARLQEQLYKTNTLAEVAIIAQKLGFNLNGAEIIQAQAGRVLAIIDEQSNDINNLLSGVKGKTGAQWGRGGGGYLDRAGFWLYELASRTPVTEVEQQINHFIKIVNNQQSLKQVLLETKTFNELAKLFKFHNISLTAVELLKYQAQKILELSEKDANIMAAN